MQFQEKTLERKFIAIIKLNETIRFEDDKTLLRLDAFAL